MRQQDKQSGTWKSFRGYRNAGWLSGFLRINPKTPRTIYLQQTNNEGLSLPIHLKKPENLPHRFKDGDPIKVYSRIVGHFNLQTNRLEVRVVALDFDEPGLTEMPAQSAWATKLPEGLSESSFIPTLFGETNSINKVVSQDRANVIEIAGHVSGFMMERARELHNGQVVARKLYMFVQQGDDVFKSIPVRYKGRNVQQLRDSIKIGTPVFVKAQLRVKHMPVPGAQMDEQGMIKTYAMMVIDGNAWGQIDPKVAKLGEHIPILQEWPTWAIGLVKNGQDAVRKALKEAAERHQTTPEEMGSRPQTLASTHVEDGLDDILEEAGA